MRKLIILLCIALTLSGCNKQGDPSPKYEDEKFFVNDIYEEIEDDCVIYYATQTEVLNMLKHGTGVIFFSWIDCPWCHRYINNLNNACLNADIEVLYYDIHDDRENNTDFYKEVKTLVNSELEAEEAFDSSGDTRIYVPNVYFIVKGEVIGHDNSSSMESGFENNGDDYWNSKEENGLTKQENLINNLNAWAKQVKEIKDEIDGKGCDTGNSCPL